MNARREFDEWIADFFSKHKVPSARRKDIVFVSYSDYRDIFREKKNSQLLVYEDFWHTKKDIMQSQISNFLHLNHRIYARECQLRKIDATIANNFLNINHLYGSCQAKIKYGLFAGEELCVVATFAAQRRFKDNRRSAELLRFCNKNYVTVVGGLSKLIKSYIVDYQPNDIMTYIISSNKSGKAFQKIGFENSGETRIVKFWINPNTHQRIPEHIARKKTEEINPLQKQITTTGIGIKMIKNVDYPSKIE